MIRVYLVIVKMEQLLSVLILVSFMLIASAQGPPWEERDPSFNGHDGAGRFPGPGGDRGFGGPEGAGRFPRLRGDRGFGGTGRPRGPRGPPGHKMPMIMIPMYSECQNFTNVMTEKFKEMWSNKEIGPGQCQGDHHDCMLKDMEKVRCRVDATPTLECMAKLKAFMEADTCSSAGSDRDENNNP